MLNCHPWHLDSGIPCRNDVAILKSACMGVNPNLFQTDLCRNPEHRDMIHSSRVHLWKNNLVLTYHIAVIPAGIAGIQNTGM